jgi:cytochrome c
VKKNSAVLFILMIASGIGLTTVSCKKEATESFGKPAASPVAIENPLAIGKEIVEGRGNCMACHQVATKSIGPSIQTIAKAYKGKKGDLVSFLKEEKEPIVDPSQYEVMKTNFVLTEEMSDEELIAIETYFYSHLK